MTKRKYKSDGKMVGLKSGPDIIGSKVVYHGEVKGIELHSVEEMFLYDDGTIFRISGIVDDCINTLRRDWGEINSFKEKYQKARTEFKTDKKQSKKFVAPIAYALISYKSTEKQLRFYKRILTAWDNYQKSKKELSDKVGEGKTGKIK